MRTGSKLTVSDAYAPVQIGGADSFDVSKLLDKTMVFRAVTNDLKFQIEGSLDDVNFVVLETDIVVVVGTNIRRSSPTHTIMGEQWKRMKVSIKPNVSQAFGTGHVQFEGVSDAKTPGRWN